MNIMGPCPMCVASRLCVSTTPLTNECQQRRFFHCLCLVLPFQTLRNLLFFRCSSSLRSLQDGEEELTLQHTILGQIGTMDSILDFILPKLRPQCVWSDVPRNLRVGGSAVLPKALDYILPSKLQRDTWAR